MSDKILLEVKDKDYCGRICKLKIGNKKIETPYIFPVVHPIKQEVDLKILKSLGFKGIITNSYILYKNRIDVNDIHSFLKFDGIIMTDSGAFQWMEYSKIKVSQEEIVNFQEKINSDLKVPLDRPCISNSYEEVKESVSITIRNLKSFIEIRKKLSLSPNWIFPVQGKFYKDLVEKSCRFYEKSKDFFEVIAVGSIVPEVTDYSFLNAVKSIVFVRRFIKDYSKPIHAFGVGHPISIPLFVFLGVDLFDSASYILLAKKGIYLTLFGSKKVNNLRDLPCSCPICRKYGNIDNFLVLKKESESEFFRELAVHNLYVIKNVIDLTKEFIREQKLFSFVASLCRSHPNLLLAFRKVLIMKEFRELVRNLNPIRKRSGYFFLKEDSRLDPYLSFCFKRAKERIGKLKDSLKYVYPFGQMVGCKIKYEENVNDEREVILDILKYEFGREVSFYLDKNKISFERSSRGRLLRVYYDNKLFGTIRSRDGFIALTLYGARILLEYFKNFRRYYIMVDSKFKSDIKGSLLRYMIIDFDKNLRAGDDVVIVDENWNLVGVGEVKVSGLEMESLNYGNLVKIRHKEKI